MCNIELESLGVWPRTLLFTKPQLSAYKGGSGNNGSDNNDCDILLLKACMCLVYSSRQFTAINLPNVHSKSVW